MQLLMAAPAVSGAASSSGCQCGNSRPRLLRLHHTQPFYALYWHQLCGAAVCCSSRWLSSTSRQAASRMGVLTLLCCFVSLSLLVCSSTACCFVSYTVKEGAPRGGGWVLGSSREGGDRQ